jgi:hypothetical protein
MGSKWNKEHREQKLAYDRQFTKQYNQEHQEQRAAYQATYHKQWYQENAAKAKARARKREQEIREFIRQQKAGLSCSRCGIADIRVLDFHHTNKDEKEISLARVSYQGWSKERILQEKAKCGVLCANCHRILHWEDKTLGK